MGREGNPAARVNPRMDAMHTTLSRMDAMHTTLSRMDAMRGAL